MHSILGGSSRIKSHEKAVLARVSARRRTDSLSLRGTNAASWGRDDAIPQSTGRHDARGTRSRVRGEGSPGRGTAARRSTFTRRSASRGESRAPVFKVRARGSAAAGDTLATARRGGALGVGRPVARSAGVEVTDPRLSRSRPDVGQLRGTEITSKSRTSQRCACGGAARASHTHASRTLLWQAASRSALGAPHLRIVAGTLGRCRADSAAAWITSSGAPRADQLRADGRKLTSDRCSACGPAREIGPPRERTISKRTRGPGPAVRGSATRRAFCPFFRARDVRASRAGRWDDTFAARHGARYAEKPTDRPTVRPSERADAAQLAGRDRSRNVTQQSRPRCRALVRAAPMPLISPRDRARVRQLSPFCALTRRRRAATGPPRSLAITISRDARRA